MEQKPKEKEQQITEEKFALNIEDMIEFLKSLNYNYNYDENKFTDLIEKYDIFMKNIQRNGMIGKFNLIIEFLTNIIDYFYIINKPNHKTIKFFLNKFSLYYLIKTLIFYERNQEILYGRQKYYQNINKYMINLNEFMIYFRAHRINPKHNEIFDSLNKMIEKFKFLNGKNQLSKLEFAQYIPDNTLYVGDINNLFADYNEHKIYSVNDFILSFILYYYNINDISTFFTLNNDEPINYIITDQIDRKIMKKNNRNIFEIGTFNDLLLYPNINYNLSLLILISSKHIIARIDNSNIRMTELLFLNFLSNFEKDIIKNLYKFQREVSTINNNIINLHKISFDHYFYDFKFFVDLLYLIQINQNIIDKTNCKNEKLIKEFENHDIATILRNNVGKSDKEKLLIFINIAKKLLENNAVNQLFTKFYTSSTITQFMTRTKLENIKKFTFNPNYINFKKPYKFVRDFNNLVLYHYIIFKSINTDEIKKFLNNDHNKFDSSFYEITNYLYYIHFRIYLDDSKEWIPSEIDKNEILQATMNTLACCKLISKRNNYYFNPLQLLLTTDMTYNDVIKSFNYFFMMFENFNDGYYQVIKDNDYVFRIPSDRYNLASYEIKKLQKNIVINIHTVSTKGSHYMSVNINFEKHYIDIYNPWGSDFNDPRNVFSNISKHIEKYFKEYYNIRDEQGNIINFTIYNYNTMMYTQSEYENFQQKDIMGYCRIFGLIYNLVRINYFNSADYSMNYVQEMINEYVQTFNHPLVFLFHFVLFLYLEYCYNFTKQELVFDDENVALFRGLVLKHIDNTKYDYGYDSLCNPETVFYSRFRSLLINQNKIEIIGRNYARIFKSTNGRIFFRPAIINRIKNNNIIIDEYQEYPETAINQNIEAYNKLFTIPENMRKHNEQKQQLMQPLNKKLKK
jgi:hypothetical protein